MKIKILSCWFATSYGAYSDHLRTALERKLGSEVGIIASNCGCGDPIEVARIFQNKRFEFVQSPHVFYYKSKNPIKYWLRLQARNFMCWLRALRYRNKNADSQILHFQQTLNAFGFTVLQNWLRLPMSAKKIVTVHEIDPIQKEFLKSNRVYNKADQVIVLFAAMKEELIRLKVKPEKISVVPYGIQILPLENKKREGIIFYGGHFIGTNKGIDSLFKAYLIVKKKLKDKTPFLKIHGHWGEASPPEGIEMAKSHGVENDIIWLNHLIPAKMIEAYQQSILCVLPYKGSSAGLAAVHAMAYGVPVIATKQGGLPDHLGEVGTYINEDAPNELAEQIINLLQNDSLRQEIAVKGRSRAEQHFSWDVIADQTMKVYEKVLKSS